jgi:hypothetical protein
MILIYQHQVNKEVVMNKPYTVTFDRSFFENLEREWEKSGYATKHQVWQLRHSLLEMDTKCEEMSRLIREEIVPATLEHDDERLYKSLMDYERLLWEIQEFGYIKIGRKAVDKILDAMNEKLHPDED